MVYGLLESTVHVYSSTWFNVRIMIFNNSVIWELTLFRLGGGRGCHIVPPPPPTPLLIFSLYLRNDLLNHFWLLWLFLKFIYQHFGEFCFCFDPPVEQLWCHRHRFGEVPLFVVLVTITYIKQTIILPFIWNFAVW